MYNIKQKSLNQEGGNQEDIPAWARTFFPYFEELDNSETPNQQALNIQDERNSALASLSGRQPLICASSNEGPIELCNKTSPNWRSTTTRRQVVGSVDMEHVMPQDGRKNSSVHSLTLSHQMQYGVQ